MVNRASESVPPEAIDGRITLKESDTQGSEGATFTAALRDLVAAQAAGRIAPSRP